LAKEKPDHFHQKPKNVFWRKQRALSQGLAARVLALPTASTRETVSGFAETMDSQLTATCFFSAA